MGATQVTTLFLDIGGVLLTNGWDHHAREGAARVFDLNYEEMNERHHLTFDTYEEGKLTLDEYLGRVVFYTGRSFSRDDFKQYMYAQSRPYSDMIDLVKMLRRRFDLRVAAISNEGRELTEHRIEAFDLTSFIDFFISSCFVHYRKPDPDIYRMALDVSHAVPERSVYIDDRPMFVDVAASLGLQGIRHQGYARTRAELAARGLSLD
jgi:putative hydrolase of the HAD superfamily